MDLFLILWACAPWMIIYICIIYVGIRDRSYGMPGVSIALNFAWECIYFLHYVQYGFIWQTITYGMWAVLNAGIVATFLRFGLKELSSKLRQIDLVVLAVIAFVTACGIHLIFLELFPLLIAEYTSAVLINTVISLLFIVMFLHRRGPRGQSMVIAVSKFVANIGLLTATGILPDQMFSIVVGIIYCTLDVIYIGLLEWARRDPIRWNGARQNA